MSAAGAISDGREPYWADTAPETGFASLSNDLTVDVAVIGGGIVGLTAAALLKQSGRRVAVLEARRVGRQATGRSTAKVTSQHGIFYADLIESHGREGAQLYAAANQAAIERISDFVRHLDIQCDFERKVAYVYARSDSKVAELEREAEAARSLGLPADVIDQVPLPFPAKAALRFTDQAQFHPCKYLAGLAQHVDGGGSYVFEATRATDVRKGIPARVVTVGGTVTARHVIVATHLPVTNRGMFFAKAYPYSEPLLAGRIEPAHAPQGMYLSADAPSLSFVVARGDGPPYLVAAGERYRTGHAEEARQAHRALEEAVRKLLGIDEIRYQWTNQDYQPMDKVPFVGRASSSANNLFVATGFRAWGLSGGTAAAMILADAINGRDNAWAPFFDAQRLNPRVSTPAFVKENARVAAQMTRGYLTRRPKSTDDLNPGEAGIFSIDGRRVAAHRDVDGMLHMVSAVCTHMKCIVAWNPIERTWDCPCHGSRFTLEGEVIEGPAVSPLAAIG